MQTAIGIIGFVGLLALATAGVLVWLLARITDRVTVLERREKALAGECRLLHQKIDLIPPPAAEPLPGPVPVSATITLDGGMNLTKRVQILRLHRRGESTAHIASVLSLPLAQVELVIKLQRHMAENPLASSG